MRYLKQRRPVEGRRPHCSERAVVMMEVIMSLPFFLLVLAALFHLADAFQQKMNNRIAARHVGEARVYLTKKQHEEHFDARALSQQHLGGRGLSFSSGPGGSFGDSGLDETTAFGIITKAAIESKSLAVEVMMVNFVFLNDDSGLKVADVRSKIPASNMLPLSRNLESRFFIARGTWTYAELGYPGVNGVRAALVASRGSSVQTAGGFDSALGGLIGKSKRARKEGQGKVDSQRGKWE